MDADRFDMDGKFGARLWFSFTDSVGTAYTRVVTLDGGTYTATEGRLQKTE